MLQDDNPEVDRIFEDLERSFSASQKKKKALVGLSFLGLPVGLVMIVVGLSVHVLVSVAGYAVMVLCVLHLVNRFRDAAMFHINRIDVKSKFPRPR